MASQPDLVKIGLEGFAILESTYGRKGRPSAPYKGSQQYTPTTKEPYGHERTKVPSMQDTVVDYKAAKLYNGALIVDYRKRIPLRKA